MSQLFPSFNSGKYRNSCHNNKIDVIHYILQAFSRNGQPTILARQTQYQNQMGNREGFSFKDIQLANTMYGCAAGVYTAACTSYYMY